METPVHVPLRRRGMIITILHGFVTHSIVPSDWDSAPRCVCGPNFIFDSIGESPIFSAARSVLMFQGVDILIFY